MAPKSDASNGIERIDSTDDDEKEGLPLTQRIRNGLANFFGSLRLFIYNKERQTVFGNTSSSWIKISVYYCVFYICLGLFYSGMIAVFGAIVSRETPTYTYKNNEMNDKGNVYIGMGFRPMPDLTDVSLTIYNDTESQNQTISSLTTYRIEFLTQYDTTYLDECSPTNPASNLRGGHSCKFSWTDIVTNEKHPCSFSNSYGWPAGQPCVLVKLNKIYGWTPAEGNIISQVVNATGQSVSAADQLEKNIYVTCNGKEPADKEKLGDMMYYSLLSPNGNPYYGGIPYYFYPYTNSREHVEPFVLVQFLSLPLNYVVNVECRAWAPNIQQLSQGTTSRGMVTFNLFKSNRNAPSAK